VNRGRQQPSLSTKRRDPHANSGTVRVPPQSVMVSRKATAPPAHWRRSARPRRPTPPLATKRAGPIRKCRRGRRVPTGGGHLRRNGPGDPWCRRWNAVRIFRKNKVAGVDAILRSGVMAPEKAPHGQLVATGPVAQWRVGMPLVLYPTKEDYAQTRPSLCRQVLALKST
jgi:hypothetical protein